MSARIEAAAKAMNRLSVRPIDWDAPTLRTYRLNRRYDARQILEAADTVMFSDEAVERAARVLVEVGQFGVPWEDASDRDRAETIDLARSVIAALRGETA